MVQRKISRTTGERATRHFHKRILNQGNLIAIVEGKKHTVGKRMTDSKRN